MASVARALSLAQCLFPVENFDQARVKAVLEKGLSGLDATITQLRISQAGWICVTLDGSDNEAAGELLRARFGEAKTLLSELEVSDIVRSFIIESSDGARLQATLGFEAEGISVQVAATVLRAQLTDGLALSLSSIRSMYCLQPGVPVELRVEAINHESRAIECWLSDSQRQVLREWAQLPFERMIAVGVLPEDLNNAIRATGLTRDVIEATPLSLGTHVLTCKIGTQAPGVIHKLGRQLRNTKLYAFIPEKVTRALRSTGELR